MLWAMTTGPFLRGSMCHPDTPDWRSLEALLGSDELCAHFMWMHDVVLEDGTVLHAYKHRWTRCYFHLADDGRAFYYVTRHLYRELVPRTASRPQSPSGSAASQRRKREPHSARPCEEPRSATASE